LQQADGLENEPSGTHIQNMNGIKPTIDSLALLVTLDDPAGEAVAAQRIDEFVAFNPNIDRKIENLELLRQAIVPMALWAEDSPHQFSKVILDIIDNRLRALEESKSR
jgi:hypothetical protein